MGGKAVILAIAIMTTGAHASPRFWSTTTPLDTWEDLTAQMAEVVATETASIRAMGGTLEFGMYAKDGVGLVITTVRLPFAASANFLSEFEEGARDEDRANELSYKSTVGERINVVDIVYKPDEGQSRVRRFTGVASNFVTSTSVLCTSEGTECPSLLASFTVDESSFALLKPILSIRPPEQKSGPRSSVDEKSDAYRYGQITGGVLLTLILGIWFWRNHGRR